MWGWNKKSLVKSLTATVEDLTKKLEVAHARTLELDIEDIETRADRKIEQIRQREDAHIAYHELESQLSEVRANMADEVEEQVRTRISEVNKEALVAEENAKKELAATKKELRGEFEGKVKSLETENKKLIEGKFDMEGRYEGLQLVVKNLQSQNSTLEKLNTTLIGKLPDVSATIKTVGDNNSTTNVNSR